MGMFDAVAGFFQEPQLRYEPQVGPQFSIKETTGQRRTLVLSGYCLPMASGAGSSAFSWTTKLRTQRTWYPGNPEATVQVLGPEEEPSNMTLRLSRRWLGDSDALMIEYDGDITNHTDPLVLADAIVSLCRAGQELEVTWGAIVRRGVASRVVVSPVSDVLVNVDVDFDWHASGDFVPQPVDVSFDFANPAQNLRQLLSEAAEIASSALGRVGEKLAEVNGIILQVNSAVDAYAALIDQTLDLAEAGRATIQNAVGWLGIVSYRAEGLMAALDIDTASASGTEDSAEAAAFFAAPAGIQDRARQMKDAAEIARKEAMDLLMGDDVIAVVIASTGQTLQFLADQYYHDRDKWPVLAQYNQLKSPVLAKGTVVAIPVLDERRAL